MLRRLLLLIPVFVLSPVTVVQADDRGAEEGDHRIGPIAVVGEGEMKLNDERMTGDDRDEHGCIRSAGYRWCERTGRCERPWLLAKEKGFENSAEAFEAYCDNVVTRKQEPRPGKE